jgi:hypothetical protein
MNMKDFHAWVKAGNFDKPREADDSHTSRLQEHNKDVLRTIQKISGQGTSPERSQLQEKMSTVAAHPTGIQARVNPCLVFDHPTDPTPLYQCGNQKVSPCMMMETPQQIPSQTGFMMSSTFMVPAALE